MCVETEGDFQRDKENTIAIVFLIYTIIYPLKHNLLSNSLPILHSERLKYNVHSWERTLINPDSVLMLYWFSLLLIQSDQGLKTVSSREACPGHTGCKRSSVSFSRVRISVQTSWILKHWQCAAPDSMP